MSLNNFRWSPSALNLLSQCGEAFRRRYVEQERTPTSPRQLRGQVIHRAAQHSYSSQLATQTLPSVKDIKDLAATDFDERWKLGVALEPEEREAGEDATKGASKDFAIDLSAYHVERVAPSVTPVAVEEKMSAALPESDILVHGVVDLIALQDGQDVVRDIKSSDKAPNANAAETSLQLTVYAQLVRAELGHFPQRLQLDYLTRSPAKRLKAFIPLVTTRDDEDIRVLGARVQAAVSLVEKGVFIPAPADSWQCSERWCPYWHDCVFVRRGARPTT